MAWKKDMMVYFGGIKADENVGRWAPLRVVAQGEKAECREDLHNAFHRQSEPDWDVPIAVKHQAQTEAWVDAFPAGRHMLPLAHQ